MTFAPYLHILGQLQCSLLRETKSPTEEKSFCPQKWSLFSKEFFRSLTSDICLDTVSDKLHNSGTMQCLKSQYRQNMNMDYRHGPLLISLAPLVTEPPRANSTTR